MRSHFKRLHPKPGNGKLKSRRTNVEEDDLDRVPIDYDSVD